DLLEMLVKLGLAVVAGGLVGLERERQEHPAGLRTHTVVCLGSTLITLVSLHLAGSRSDPTRIAAQIVSGIGFLGAGTIYRSGSGVRGLTTAAGLWTVAGIGMGIAAGGSLLYLGLVTAAMVFGVNKWLGAAENRWVRVYRELVLTISRGRDGLSHVVEELAQRGIEIQRVQWMGEEGDEAENVVRLRVRLPSSSEANALTAWLSAQPGVRDVEWQ
ncbi:MAG TPA: MgtC/SapB family protein, partial [Armatimonadota bacterium]|nr:MgtC/SapB family protein [Armatimonadota bacterium]